MLDSIPLAARRLLLRVMRDLRPFPADLPAARRAIILALADARVPTEIVTLLRPHIDPFAAAVLADRIDLFAHHPWEDDPAPAAPPAPEARERALIERLIASTRLYSTSAEVKQLLAFVNRLRAFAPFNAMLLHIQKPGLTHAATASDWWTRFGRVPRRHARPLLVLRTMGPVDFVFDVQDTEGRDLPPAAFAFPVLGNLSQAALDAMLDRVRTRGVKVDWVDKGDAFAGSIELQHHTEGLKIVSQSITITLNRNHPPAQVFITLCHELAHLLLGHLGLVQRFKVADRSEVPFALREIEAETVAYVVGHRNGIQPRSESYLDEFKDDFGGLNFHAVFRAANAIETLIGRPAQDFQPRGTGTKG